jgi:Mrp family chromosome partitioning ATPase
VAFGLERIDRRLRTVDEASRAFGLPVIAAIPHERDISPKRGQEVSVAEGVRETFRSLRSNLDISVGKGKAGSRRASAKARTILVTSAVPAEGKSTVVRNLALVYAEAGLSVVIVEADLRRPTLARTLAVEPEPGLTDVLMGLVAVDEAMQSVPVELPEYPRLREPSREIDQGELAVLSRTNGGGDSTGHLRLLASGPKPADPPAMFAAPSLEALVRNLESRHDVVLIDSPPLLAVSDAVPLMTIADGTVVVCRVGASTEDGAARLLNLVNRVPDAHMLGLVVNDVDSGSRDRYGAY